MFVLIHAGLAAALLTASIVDFRTRRLPDLLTLPLIAAGLGITQTLSPVDLTGNIVAAIVGFSVLWLVARVYRSLRRFDGLGLGDAKLLAAAGAWLGPAYLAPVVFVSAVLALGTALALRLSGRQVSFQTTLPFGPFLSASFFGLWCVKVGGWSIF